MRACCHNRRRCTCRWRSWRCGGWRGGRASLGGNMRICTLLRPTPRQAPKLLALCATGALADAGGGAAPLGSLASQSCGADAWLRRSSRPLVHLGQSLRPTVRLRQSWRPIVHLLPHWLRCAGCRTVAVARGRRRTRRRRIWRQSSRRNIRSPRSRGSGLLCQERCRVGRWWRLHGAGLAPPPRCRGARTRSSSTVRATDR